jgi:hypothetical protein
MAKYMVFHPPTIFVAKHVSRNNLNTQGCDIIYGQHVHDTSGTWQDLEQCFERDNPEGRSSFFFARAVVVLHETEMSSQDDEQV